MLVQRKNRSFTNNIDYEGNLDLLKIGSSYVVYGVEVIDTESYYLLARDNDYTPRLYNTKNFHMLDESLSKHWNLSVGENTGRYLFNDWLEFDDYLEWFFNGVLSLNIDEFDCPVDYFPYYQELIKDENSMVNRVRRE